MKNIVTVNGIKYKIESTTGLTSEQLNEISRQLSINGSKENTMLTLATCPSTGKKVGEVATLSATPTGGTPPYTVKFQRSGSDLPNGTFTSVTEGTQKSLAYTLTSSDTPSVVLSVVITDSCPSGAKQCTDSCTITVSVCAIPSCGFTVT